MASQDSKSADESVIIDPEWIDPTNIDVSDYTCSICHGIFRNAVQTQNGAGSVSSDEGCGHYFCQNCLLQSLQRKQSCPLCRSRLLVGEYVADGAMRRKVKNLKVRCHNDFKLCQAKGQLGNGSFWAQHKEECLYETITCILCSSFTTIRKHLPGHLLQCKEAYIPCLNRCGQVIQAIQQEEHKRNCPSLKTMVCNDCKQTITLTQAKVHKDVCEMAQVACDYAGMGCVSKFTRKEAAWWGKNHLDAQVNYHLSLVQHHYSRLETELISIKAEMKELKESLVTKNKRKRKSSITDVKNSAPLDSKIVLQQEENKLLWSYNWLDLLEENKKGIKAVSSKDHVEAYGRMWKLTLELDKKNGENALSLYLQSYLPKKNSSNSSLDIQNSNNFLQIHFTLGIIDPRSGNVVKELYDSKIFKEDSNWGFPSFISISELDNFGLKHSQGLTSLIFFVSMYRNSL